MGLTITIHLIRCADAPPTAGLGDGGGTVTWLPGRVLTAGRVAAVEAASQIPAGWLGCCRGRWSKRRGG